MPFKSYRESIIGKLDFFPLRAVFSGAHVFVLPEAILNVSLYCNFQLPNQQTDALKLFILELWQNYLLSPEELVQTFVSYL